MLMSIAKDRQRENFLSDFIPGTSWEIHPVLLSLRLLLFSLKLALVNLSISRKAITLKIKNSHPAVIS